MGLGQTGPEISSPAHLLGHSWSYGELESGPIENILGQIDYICPNRLCLIFMKLDHADQIYSLWPTFAVTRGPMLGQGVRRSKIYLFKSVLYVPICIMFDFQGARSNRSRDILRGPSWYYVGLECGFIENIPC